MGIATVFRGGKSLGEAYYVFTVDSKDRVTGSVTHLDHALEHRSHRVPQTFLRIRVGKTELHLTMTNGQTVDFSVLKTTGAIAMGRVRTNP